MADDNRWADAVVGRVLCGRYKVSALVGSGGMGAVLRATHTGTGRDVAVKVIRPELAKDGDAVRRFHLEARSAAAVGCKGVVDVLDLDVDPELGPILVLELLEGESLHERIIRERGLPPRDVVRIGLEILETLGAVHAKGIVHRDLKPANVFLARGPDGERVKLVDFGIARVEASMRTRALTLPGMALGTPRYMAPEQAHGVADIDGRADLYSAGALLYFALAGKPPYAELSSDEAFVAMLAGPPKPLAEIAPAVPPALAAVVARAMERDREARFQTAQEARAALSSAAEAQSEDVPATRLSVPRPSSAGAAAAAVTAPRASRATAPPVARRGFPLKLAGLVAIGAVALLTGGGLLAALELGWLSPGGEDTAAELRAAVTRARAQLAAGHADLAGKELNVALGHAQLAEATTDERVALPYVEACVLRATANVRLLESDAACEQRAASAEITLREVGDEVAKASGIRTVALPVCDVAELAGAELSIATGLAAAQGADVAPCRAAARVAARAAERHAALAVDPSNVQCTAAARDVQSRAAALGLQLESSTIVSPIPSGGGAPVEVRPAPTVVLTPSAPSR